MTSAEEGVQFQRAIISVREEKERLKDNFWLHSDFNTLKECIFSDIGIEMSTFSISFQVFEDGKDGVRQHITNQTEYSKYINTVKLYDYNSIHIFLEDKDQQTGNLILDDCFKKEDLHESFEMEKGEDDNSQNINNQKLLTEGLAAANMYDASEAITEQSEVSVHPSLQLSHFQSKQKSTEGDLLVASNSNGSSNNNILSVPKESKETKSSNYSSLSSKKNDTKTREQSNSLQNSQDRLSLDNQEQVQNIIDFEIVRQILNKFPKLQLENSDDDIIMKVMHAYYQSSTQNNRRSTSPQPKQCKKVNDLSQSLIMQKYKCDSCKKQIENTRFHCLVCQNTDHCEACQKEKRLEHNHPFMKYKNIPASKSLTKSQRFQPQPVNSMLQQESQGGNTGFMLPCKSAQSTYFFNPNLGNQSKPLMMPILANTINSSSQNTPIAQGTGLSFFTQTKIQASPLAQTMPSAIRQQQAFQQPQLQQQMLLLNNLQSSQNLNIPLSSMHPPTNHIDEIFQNQAMSQTFNQTQIGNNISNAAPSQNKFKHAVHQVQQFQTLQNSANNSRNLLSDIKILNLSSFSGIEVITINRGGIFKVAFTLKNGGERTFPQGGYLRCIESTWPDARKQVSPLRSNETQLIEFELRAPDVFPYTRFHTFKVEFPSFSEKGAFEQRGPRFDFQLITT